MRAIRCVELRCDLKGQLRVDIELAQPGDHRLRGYDSSATAERCAGAFEEGVDFGMMQLVLGEVGSLLPSHLSFLREFMKGMTTYFLLALRANPRARLDPPTGLIESWVRMSRRIPEFSRLKASYLRHVWRKHQEGVLTRIRGGLGDFVSHLSTYHPLWYRIGDIVMNIELSSGNAALPFVVSFHYVDGLSTTSHVRTSPLYGPIFGDVRVAGLGDYYLGRLGAMAERSSVIRRLLDSQEIFSPCGMIPRDTHQLLLDAPILEELGVDCRVPQWWRSRRPPRLEARARLGSSSPSANSASGMLDVTTSYVVDEEELTQAEWRRLVEDSVSGLVNLRGRWIEVDRESIRRALDSWRRVAQLEGRGQVSYAEAVGLLGESQSDNDSSLASGGASGERILAGRWLTESLHSVKSGVLQGRYEPGAEFFGILRPYQRQGVAWLGMLMELKAGALLADEMGLGKTVQVIALILCLRRSGVSEPFLLVVPASVIGNWSSELAKFAPSVSFSVEHHEYEESTVSIPADLTITSYSTLRRRPALRESEWGLVVIDEAQIIKNNNTATSKAIKALRAERRIALTGTPVENRLTDLWSIMDFLNPGALGTLATFRKKWATGSNKYEDVDSLRAAVRPYMLRRRKSDPGVASELPEKVEVTAHCGLTATQSALYAQVLCGARSRVEAVEGIERDSVVLNVILQLKEICNHPALYLGEGDYDYTRSSKFIRLRQICEQIAANGERVLVFTQFSRLLSPLSLLLLDVFGQPGLTLGGKTPVARRPAIVADFQKENGPPFMILTVKAGGTGLNLTSASHVVHFDLWWNPAAEAQATDRAHRIGQTKRVMVHRLVCRGTLEEGIDKILQRKRAIAEDLLAPDMEDLRLTSLSDDELIRLIHLNEGQARASEGLDP